MDAEHSFPDTSPIKGFHPHPHPIPRSLGASSTSTRGTPPFLHPDVMAPAGSLRAATYLRFPGENAARLTLK